MLFENGSKSSPQKNLVEEVARVFGDCGIFEEWGVKVIIQDLTPKTVLLF
jgi:hypothetical protein